MAGHLYPTCAIPGSHQLIGMEKPTREFSTGRDVKVSNLDIHGPRYRLSERCFEGVLKSDAKMSIAGLLVTFVVGLVGYILVSNSLILLNA